MSINTLGSSIVAGKLTVLFLAKSASAFRIVFPLRVRGSACTFATSRKEAIGLVGTKLAKVLWLQNIHPHPMTSLIVLIISTDIFAGGFLQMKQKFC